MSKRKKNKHSKAKRSSNTAQAATKAPESALLWLLASLAAVSALWSAFQWNELLTLRSGGEIFCALGPGASCALLADSDFAIAVQQLTGLPVAAWGLVWSGAALALPVGALLRRSAKGSDEPFWTGALLTAAAGVAGVLVLAAVSLSKGGFCSNCVITYVLVLAFAGVCGLRFSRAANAKLEPGAGAGVASLAVGIGFVALIYPGLQTPLPPDEQAKAAMSKVLGDHGHSAGDHSGHDQGQSVDSLLMDARGLEELVATLSPEMKQTMSNSLAFYAASRASGAHDPRALHGSADAPVRITDFTDALCGHCASLHAALETMYDRVPEGSFAIDSRHFPLDGNCNPQVRHSYDDPVRCVSAAAQICLEDDPEAFHFAGQLFANQRHLDTNMVYDLAATYIDRDELKTCVESSETKVKLQADIAWALGHNIRGTPLVLINGRRATSFAPFLFAMVTTQGGTEHAAFDLLPPPRSPKR